MRLFDIAEAQHFLQTAPDVLCAVLVSLWNRCIASLEM